MGAKRKRELESRLEAYFAMLRPPALKEVLKHAANWQMYAAVTGSAMAMATSSSAAVIGSGIRDAEIDRQIMALAAQRYLASPELNPLMNAVRKAMARQYERAGHARVQLVQPNAVQTAPTINQNGVVPIYASVDIIQPGEWVSIFGNNLASQETLWNGDFPTELGGTRVEINGKPAYLMYVSPTQINLQAPDDTARGTVPVVVTTAAGSVTTTVTLSDFGPSFSLFDQTGRPYVAGIIVRKDGSGAYGGGTYDILGPTGNALGFATVAAAPGDTVELFGVGFGPTKPPVPAGKLFSGAAPITSNYKLYINRVAVDASFVGLSGAGLYQVNLTVPQSVGGGDVPIRLIIGGSTQTQATVFFPLAGSPAAGSPSYYPGYGGFTTFPGFYFGSGLMPGAGFTSPGGLTSRGFSGGFSGGSFGGSAEVRTRQYTPRLPSAPK